MINVYCIMSRLNLTFQDLNKIAAENPSVKVVQLGKSDFIASKTSLYLHLLHTK